MEMPYNYIRQGWQCPVCGKVHAPWVSACDCHITIAKGTPTTNVDYTRQESITASFAEQTNRRVNDEQSN